VSCLTGAGQYLPRSISAPRPVRHARPVDTALHRVEALPGEGRFVVTFRRGDGGEQNAVVELRGTDVRVAESSLPAGWEVGTPALDATIDTVRALDAARRLAPAASSLRDIDGGWDVGLGNVVLGGQGMPRCTAHGDLALDGAVWVCAECGARAVLA
jgi:hypothetical protein